MSTPPPSSSANPSLLQRIAKLPDICKHKIYRYLHEMYMKDLKREIIHNVVWVRLRSGNNYRYQFLTSTQTNYPKWNNQKDYIDDNEVEP